MKRGEGVESSSGPVSSSNAMDREIGMEIPTTKSSFGWGSNKAVAPATSSDLAPLMVEQNILLIEQNSILNKILKK